MSNLPASPAPTTPSPATPPTPSPAPTSPPPGIRLCRRSRHGQTRNSDGGCELRANRSYSVGREHRDDSQRADYGGSSLRENGSCHRLPRVSDLWRYHGSRGKLKSIGIAGIVRRLLNARIAGHDKDRSYRPAGRPIDPVVSDAWPRRGFCPVAGAYLILPNQQASMREGLRRSLPYAYLDWKSV